MGLPPQFGVSNAWAAAVPWQKVEFGRMRPLEIPKEGRSGFTQLAAELTGLSFSNHLADVSAGLNQVRMNGSGVAAGDIDGDGWCDLYFCGLESRSRLYRNQGGWKFEDITAESGLAHDPEESTGAAFADVDGDGDLDLLINRIGRGTQLFLNDGHGHFSESIQKDLQRPSGSMSMALADLDGDGDLDLYVVNYRTNTIHSTGFSSIVDGRGKVRPEYAEQYQVSPGGRLIEFGEPDALFLNDGHGHFSLASWTDGRFVDESGKPLTQPPRDWGLSVILRDFDGDGTPDIYVCNDFWTPDRLWLNDGQGHFRAAPSQMLRHTSNFSMGIDVADIDRDGFDDFLVLDMLSRDFGRRMTQRAALGQTANNWERIDARPQIERNTLFWNRGDGTYSEIAYAAGLEASEWSWGVAFLDVDLDGYEDVLITNGHLFDMLDDDMGLRLAASPKRPLAERLLAARRLDVATVAFRNLGNRQFQEIGSDWGFRHVGVSHGLALADLDNDGDIDVVVNTLNTPAAVFRNNSTAPRLAVRLRDDGPNTHGISARIRVLGGSVPQSQTIGCGGRYLSSDDPSRTFAVGSNSHALTVEVTWSTRSTPQIQQVPANSWVEIHRSKTQIVATPSIPVRPAPLFTNVSARLGHVHLDERFDDFGRQPEISRRLDSPGPGILWCDLDGDGWEDLIIGGGKGSTPGLFLNDHQGGFHKAPESASAASLTHEQTSLLGIAASDGKTGWVAGVSTYEDSDVASLSPVDFHEVSAGNTNGISLPQSSCVGPLAMADVNGDGQLDLFVGGRVNPGQYPKPASSALFLSTGSGWKLDETNRGLLTDIGMVQGAVFTDLDQDGDPDLVLACDWGPVRVFQNDQGVFREITEKLGLQQYTGWWNGVTAADVDGDGRLDLLATNAGINTSFQPFLDAGVRIYYGDLTSHGRWDVFESVFDLRRSVWVPWRDRRTLLRAMPWLQERWSSTETFAAAPLSQFFSKPQESCAFHQVHWLKSTAFLNRGDHFEAIEFPYEAQITPGFGIGVADFDGDGIEDVVLGQNFFGWEPLLARSDAGRGLFLHGKGNGSFEALSTLESGIRIEGEQRGVAVADYDHDGRPDVAIGQHGGPTQLFRNQGSRMGLRVRLRGPTSNRLGMGVVLRPHRSSGWGPSREMHAGSGYNSMDSSVTVFANEPALDSLTVRWPYAKPFTVSVPSHAKEVEVDASGALRVVPSSNP